jgi:ligand-binding sensor domain-containing protein
MKRLVAICFVVTLSTVCFSQIPFFQAYTLLKKNEPVQINAIFQDNSGYLWFGSNKGLFRFDGITFRRFTTTDGLPDQQVTAIAQDSLGRIWTGHKNGKIAILEKEKITLFNPPEGTSNQEVSDLLFDPKGNLWFSTINDGLYYFTKERLYRLDDTDGLPDLFIYDLELDNAGQIWAGTDGGLAICTLVDRKVNIRIINSRNGLPDNIVKKIRQGKKNTMLVGTEDAGLIQVDPGAFSFIPVTVDPAFGTINDFILHENKIWISSGSGGLFVLNPESHQTEKLSPASDITRLFKDNQGNIWAGTKTGIVRTPGQQLEFIDSFEPFKDQNVVAVTVDHQDAIWFSTGEGLFKRTIGSGGHPVVEKKLVGSPYLRNTVISLYTDIDGYVWAGLYGEGVLRISPSGSIRLLNSELRNGNILSITGKGHDIWLATLGGGSHITIQGEQLIVKNYGSGEGLATDYIYQVFIDSQNRIWFGTDGKGVDQFDGKRFHHFEKGLNSRIVYGFAEDNQHRIWVNVQGDGLYRFDGSSFQRFGKELRDNNVSGFSSDARGNLVVTNDLGIDFIDVALNKVRSLGEEAGIRGRVANLNAVCKDHEGNIYFGTDGGIMKYDGSGYQLSFEPVPFINGVKAGDQKMDITGDLNFSHNQNDITISYLGFWFQDPQNLNFQYKLDDYDRDWIQTKDRSVTYSSLPPGTYVLRLKVSDTNDFRESRESILHFSISPPFWRTAWFYFISSLIIGFTTYSIVKYRERQLENDKHILEMRVRDRTLEIQRKTDEILAQNEEIQAQTEEIKGINENLEMLVRERTGELERKNRALEEYAFINAHELRAPVASILGLINLMRTIELNEEEKACLEHLQRSADKLDAVVNSITRAIESGDKASFPKVEGDI